MNTGLSTQKLEKDMRCLLVSIDKNKYPLNFLGVFPLDHYPFSSVLNEPSHLPHPMLSSTITSKRKAFFCIVNSDTSNKPGSHWLASFLDYSLSIPYLEFFDSYGFSPNIYKLPLPIDHPLFSYNHIQLQSNLSTVCGHYCLLFLYLRAIAFISKPNQSPHENFHSVIKSLEGIANTSAQRDKILPHILRTLLSHGYVLKNNISQFSNISIDPTYINESSLILNSNSNKQYCIAYNFNPAST